MDPLGAQVPVVELESLPRWQSSEVPHYDIVVEDPDNMRKSPFSFDPSINDKIVLWSGDLTQLSVEAIINSTNEAMTDKNPLSERLFSKAGPQLRQDIKANIKTCRTGEAKITRGYKLLARYVIHTVGPRYNIRYKTAAESALYNSYRHVLQLVGENNISTLGLSCIHSLRRGYPSYEGAHIAIRTVRRFLEKFGDTVDTIVFVITGEDEDVYLNLMPLYFPRTKNEEDFSAYHLPYDVGNEDGEPVITERQIRIMPKPTVASSSSVPSELDFETSVNINEAFETSTAVGAHDFAKMRGDVDKQKRQRVRGRHLGPEFEQFRQEQIKRYERWVRKARQEDLSEISRLRCLYQSGFDRHGRPVIVFVGKNFPAQNVNMEKAVMYLINSLDGLVNQNFVVVYLHTLTNNQNFPQGTFLKDVYNLLDHRYKKNLKAFYILHPTFWSKVYTWFFTTFSLADLKGKVYHIPGLEYIYSRIAPDQLDLPDFVLQYDMQVNGTRYYSPEEDQAIGAL